MPPSDEGGAPKGRRERQTKTISPPASLRSAAPSSEGAEKGGIPITISQIISACDALRPNRFDAQVKISWLSELDGRIFLEIFKTHENCPADSFSPYDSNQCSLLVPAPFANELYTSYLYSCMDRENGEMNRYNQSAAQFNAVFKQFQDWWNRENKPVSAGEFKIRGEEKCPVSPL